MSWFTNNTAVDDTLQTWICEKFVADLMWDLQFDKFTVKATIPEGHTAGTYVTFSPPVLTTGYALGSAALTQGTTSEHEITSITTTGATCTPAEYGEWYRLGKLMEYGSAKGQVEKIQKRMNDGAALAMDSAIRADALTSTYYGYAILGLLGTSRQFTTTVPATVGRITADTIMSAKKDFKSKYNVPFRGVQGHTDGHFAMILTPTQELDIVTEAQTTRGTWFAANTMVPGPLGQTKWVNGYIGSIYGIACYSTQDYTTTTLTSSCEIAYLLGDGGLGSMSFMDADPRIIFNNNLASPFNNVRSIAWYAMWDGALVDTNRVMKLYSLT